MSGLLDMPVNQNARSSWEKKTFTRFTPLVIIFSRTFLFAFFQLSFYALFTLMGKDNPWMRSAAYWPFAMILTNIVSAITLTILLKREGSRFRDFFAVNKPTIVKDALLALGLFLVVGILGFLPSPLLGNWFFGDAMLGNRLLFQPLPQWAAVVSVILFPISMPFGELTTYFGYGMPRLELATKSKALSIVLPALLLSFQHAALPLLFNFNGLFLLWRALVFLPFAFSLAFIIRWKPRLFPYFLIGHFLIDIGTAMMFFFPME